MKKVNMKVIEVKERDFADAPVSYSDMMQAALDDLNKFLLGEGLDADSIIQIKDEYFDMRPRTSNSILYLTVFYKEDVNHDS